ncbi:hypothetical protein MICA_1649 [Micavibrio aeruginosavorus ARL-13]|uniref:Uncharacterized protein n=1 Tax=Micavibrio aeruginosavorus (strain ARL-13) TaxID=856793 RepID=G2KQN4_MICAA|nr:hypothetical protein MICA_1649 [Micavibrio aeruginosavorus ARL-13]
MFRDLFDLSKSRSLKESVGFYIFYGAVGLGITGLVGLFA